jgi:hypothetical protein
MRLAALLFAFVLRRRCFQRLAGAANASVGDGSGDGGGSDMDGGGSAGSSVLQATPPARLLREWLQQLDYFLSFVPVASPSSEVLFELRRALGMPKSGVRADF